MLTDGERELDSHSVSVTPQARVGLATRIGDWIRRNALLLVLVLGMLLVALAVGAVLYVRRLRTSAGAPAPTSPPPAGPSPPPAPAKPPAPRSRRAAGSTANGGSRGRPGPGLARDGAGKVSLAQASFADLRALGMSTTQANRVLRFRDQRGGFTSVDDLDEVPGFPAHLRAEVKRNLVE